MTKATSSTTTSNATTGQHGAEVFIPLNKLKKSPRNARKTAHSQAAIEAKAASIAAKGILQNLVVEPERDEQGKETGLYLVTIGEGRRLAQLLRAKRKEIKKTEPVRCVIDITNDPQEISLDENVTREAMHPADQFEAFRDLSDRLGWRAEDIAARFGVSAHVVRQRLRLAAVSPRLMQHYRDGELALDQLMAFALVSDHARQEQVYDNLSWNRDAALIRRELTQTHVAASDRRAIFVGAEAYVAAGGAILRDLFTEDRGGFFDDPALLDRLVTDKLEQAAAEVRQEGWKWVGIHIDYPHANGLRRCRTETVELSPDDQAAFDAALAAHTALSDECEQEDAWTDEANATLAELEAEMERLDALREVYKTENIARGGAYVLLSHGGTVRVERGFIRAEDEAPEPDEAEGDAETDDGSDTGSGKEAGDTLKLSDALTRGLTAHRTLGLRFALGEQPEVALVAVTHALAAQSFYQAASVQCLDIRPGSVSLTGHAADIDETTTAALLAERHGAWKAQLPGQAADLWGFVSGLDHASLMDLFAHCASLTVNAVQQQGRGNAVETADALASALELDMATHWSANERTYLGRVSKAQILAAVREGAGDAAADRLAGMKRAAMAEVAGQMLAGTGWLPALLRTQTATQGVTTESGAVA